MDRFVVKTKSNDGSHKALELNNSNNTKPDLLSQLRTNVSNTTKLYTVTMPDPPSTKKRKSSASNHLETNNLPSGSFISKNVSSNSAATEWAAREQSTVRAIDIKCQQMRKDSQIRNYVGWKTDIQGQKVYTTFRAGERVTVGGQEGFKLALGDEKSTSKKRKTQDAIEEK
jgi:hypothetical protein